MPDLEQQPHTDASRPSTPESAEAEDSLSRLHRMSRTAGLGAQDYVAINATAVTALLLGFASALALLSPVLLIVPVAGVICAVLALWQISDSNGTQTGRGLALLGLLLSVAFAGLVGTRSYMEERRMGADRQAVIDSVAEFGQRLIREDFTGAYEMTGERFRERIPMSEFEGQLRGRFGWAPHGKIESMRSNGLVFFESDEQDNRFATTQAVIHLTSGREDRQQIALAKAGDRWLIEGWGWFPPRAIQPAR